MSAGFGANCGQPQNARTSDQITPSQLAEAIEEFFAINQHLDQNVKHSKAKLAKTGQDVMKMYYDTWGRRVMH